MHENTRQPSRTSNTNPAETQPQQRANELSTAAVIKNQLHQTRAFPNPNPNPKQGPSPGSGHPNAAHLDWKEEQTAKFAGAESIEHEQQDEKNRWS